MVDSRSHALEDDMGATRGFVGPTVLRLAARGGGSLAPCAVAAEPGMRASHTASTCRFRPDPLTISAVRTFLRCLPASYAIREVSLFGSRARGDHRCDSDADVLVVLAGQSGQRYRVAGQMAEIAFDVMLETGIAIDPLPVWEGEFERPEAFPNPALLAAIARDGLRM